MFATSWKLSLVRHLRLLFLLTSSSSLSAFFPSLEVLLCSTVATSRPSPRMFKTLLLMYFPSILPSILPLLQSTTVAEESISNMRTVRSFTAEEFAIAQYHTRVFDSFELARKRAHIFGMA